MRVYTKGTQFIRAKRWMGAGLLLVVLLLTACGNTSREEVPAGPEETPATQEAAFVQEVEAVFHIDQQMEQEDIGVKLEQIAMVKDADFREGGRSDALVVTLSIDNENAAGLQLHPESGKILLATGEELLSPLRAAYESYPNGTVKKGDFYFPLQLTKLNEISGLTLLLEGPANQYYEPVGEEYVFRVGVTHPAYQEVERSVIIQRVYDQSATLAQASGVTDTFHAGQQIDMGPMTIHLMEVMVYENIQHPYAAFLNLEEPVHFVGVSLAVENRSDDTVYFSSARHQLVLDKSITKDLDHLMSRYIGQVFYESTIKTGTAFFQVEEEELASLSAISLIMESPWALEGDKKRVLSKDQRVDLGGL